LAGDGIEPADLPRIRPSRLEAISGPPIDGTPFFLSTIARARLR
jgi:hypothetical protein